jgi:hypothetical protein
MMAASAPVGQIVVGTVWFGAIWSLVIVVTSLAMTVIMIFSTDAVTIAISAGTVFSAVSKPVMTRIKSQRMAVMHVC